VMDSRYWRAESTLLSMLIHTFRMCYALATNVDEVFQFSHGAVTLSLDRVLVEVLNFAVGMQFPECLYGLANQMLVHQTPRLLLRGRLITPYDLLAMIPISHAQVENPDSLAASRIIDARPRGRVHASCFMRSTPNSNHITDADIYWRRVIAASVFVFIGGIFVSRQANARFTFL
ncbi:GPI-anchored surface protein, putative, partial [Bodo saltans]